MKIKTNEASGPALDWMVAKCEGVEVNIDNIYYPPKIDGVVMRCGHDDGAEEYLYEPSTNWSLGGPIIEREKIDVFNQNNGKTGAIEMATAKNPHPAPYFGPTALIAAMRCYVASVLGTEVEVPNELTGETA